MFIDGEFRVSLEESTGCCSGTVREIESWMDHYQIDKAVILASIAGPHRCEIANQRVIELASTSGRLIAGGLVCGPCIPGTPSHTGIKRLIERGPINIYRICDPLGLRNPYTGQIPGPESAHLLRLLEENGRTLRVDLGNASTLDNHHFQLHLVECLLKSHPGLRIALNGVGYRQAADYLVMADLYPNLYLACTWLSLHGLLQGCVRSIGSHRFYFASCGPEWDPSVTIGNLVYANLCESDFLAIAQGTMASLLCQKREGGV